MRAIDCKHGTYFLTEKGALCQRITPGKSLFHSTTIHEVINRGDIFVADTDRHIFTILSGKAEVTPVNPYAVRKGKIFYK